MGSSSFLSSCSTHPKIPSMNNRFIKVANETMCRPIRALTEARGYATSKHTCVFLPQFLRCTYKEKPTASQVSVEQAANTPAKSQVSSGSKRSSYTDIAPFSPRMDWPLQTGSSFLPLLPTSHLTPPFSVRIQGIRSPRTLLDILHSTEQTNPPHSAGQDDSRRAQRAPQAGIRGT